MNEQQLQSLRNLGNEAAANEICRLRDELELCCKLKRDYQQQAAWLAARGVPADLRKAAERTREDLGPTGSNYPDIRVLLAFAEQALAATKATPAQAQQAARACAACNGTGQQTYFSNDPEWPSEEGPCDLCDGTGQRAATPAQAQQAEAVALPPIARRRVFDAIAGAYDLGYNDRRLGRIGGVKEVEIDHGGALIAALERALAATKAEAKPLTDEQKLSLWKDAHWKFETNALAFARDIERACAEKWGVKLAGIGTKERGK